MFEGKCQEGSGDVSMVSCRAVGRQEDMQVTGYLSQRPSVAAEKERERKKPTLLCWKLIIALEMQAPTPGDMSTPWKTRVGRPHFLSREPDCQIAFGLRWLAFHSSLA